MLRVVASNRLPGRCFLNVNKYVYLCLSVGLYFPIYFENVTHIFFFSYTQMDSHEQVKNAAVAGPSGQRRALGLLLSAGPELFPHVIQQIGGL